MGRDDDENKYFTDYEIFVLVYVEFELGWLNEDFTWL